MNIKVLFFKKIRKNINIRNCIQVKYGYLYLYDTILS